MTKGNSSPLTSGSSRVYDRFESLHGSFPLQIIEQSSHFTLSIGGHSLATDAEVTKVSNTSQRPPRFCPNLDTPDSERLALRALFVLVEKRASHLIRRTPSRSYLLIGVNLISGEAKVRGCCRIMSRRHDYLLLRRLKRLPTSWEPRELGRTTVS
jgi:hypothetical protein